MMDCIVIVSVLQFATDFGLFNIMRYNTHPYFKWGRLAQQLLGPHTVWINQGKTLSKSFAINLNNYVVASDDGGATKKLLNRKDEQK